MLAVAIMEVLQWTMFTGGLLLKSIVSKVSIVSSSTLGVSVYTKDRGSRGDRSPNTHYLPTSNSEHYRSHLNDYFSVSKTNESEYKQQLCL